MEQNNKTLLVAVLIILLALVAFNFNKISGRVVGDGSDVSVVVSPSIVTFSGDESAKFVTVTVDTGSVGVDSQLELFSVNSGLKERVSISDTLCGTQSICNGVVSKQFLIPARVQSGDYIIRVERSNPSYNFKVDSNIFTINHVG
ncbi:hypothetical protein HYV88_00145 [Candidatus Woesearchaeota archaeon]|nr:hypothetical protein [Candidatus Woesearchaeota archaeon]